MSQLLAIARKEIRAYFLSPVALIFLSTFLFVALFTFFWVEAFFGRNVADVRPLFAWLPLLLVFLGAALTMRLWSEEQKLGTLEMLLTFPVPIGRLVLGKFLAGFALVALALGLTFGIPLTVAHLGDLDWGPVIGAYLGALLLAGAYLALGLCVSAATENQIVALFGSGIAGGLLYAAGTDPITRAFGNRGSEILRAIGTGSRFESIARGVIDLRDVAYYGGLTVFFLALNVVLLESKRWSHGPRSDSRRAAAKLSVALVAANVVLLDVWLAPVGSARLDLTQKREYSVSPVTRDLVRSLDEPLLIRGYFSEKTHPLLAPQVPRIRDLIQEYAVISGGKVRAEMVDPKTDAALEEEASQAFGIKSFPFRVANRYEAGIVNSYFSILVKYGDQFEVLDFNDLIEVQVTGDNVEVRLRNLEYDLTRAIKKVAFGFQSIDAVLADMREPAQLTAYVTPKTLPDNFKELPDRLTKVCNEIEGRSKGKFRWNVVDPDETPGMREKLAKEGLRPFTVSLFSRDTFFFNLVLSAGRKTEQVVPPESMTEADLKKEIEAALKRATPGFLKTVGLVKPPAPPEMAMQGQMGQPPRDETRALRSALAESYTVTDVDLESGRVPGDVDVLLVVAPRDLDARKQFAVDQYLMRGGAVIVLGGRYQLSDSPYAESLQVDKVTTGLEDALASYGITLSDALVMDAQNESFPVPVVRDLGFARVREIQQIQYPFFVDVRRDGMSEDSPLVAGLSQVALQWASPIVVNRGTGSDAPRIVELVRSSPKSWTTTETDVEPDFRKHPELGFAQGDKLERQVLAVSVTGKLRSAFAEKPSPLFGADGATAEAGKDADRTGRTIKESPDTARLVVVASSSFVNDQVLSLLRETGSEGAINGIRLLENAVDWALEDADLLTIRSRGAFARTLVPMSSKDRSFWEWCNYGVVVLALAAIVAVTVLYRRRLEPLALAPRASEPASRLEVTA